MVCSFEFISKGQVNLILMTNVESDFQEKSWIMYSKITDQLAFVVKFLRPRILDKYNK